MSERYERVFEVWRRLNHAAADLKEIEGCGNIAALVEATATVVGDRGWELKKEDDEVKSNG